MTIPTTITAMIRRHRDLYRQMDDLYEVGGDDVTGTEAYETLSSEAIELEAAIVAERPERKGDVGAKRQFILKMDFLSEDEGYLGRLLEALLARDAEAVGATPKQLEAALILG